MTRHTYATGCLDSRIHGAREPAGTVEQDRSRHDLGDSETFVYGLQVQCDTWACRLNAMRMSCVMSL